MDYFSDITALGLVALLIMVAYYSLNKLFRILTNHLERMFQQQDNTNMLLLKCAEQLEAIQESLSFEPWSEQ